MSPDAPSAYPSSHRALHSRLLPAGLLLLAVASALLALPVRQDATDTVLGAVCGASVVLLLGVLLLQLLGARARRRDRAARDQRDLDGLEPLRAARRDPAHEQGA